MTLTTISTQAVRTGINTDPAHQAVVAPIYLSSTYHFTGLEQKGTYDYSRVANPTRDVLAANLAQLEGGAGASIVASGTAAAMLALELIPAGSLVLASHDCYGGTWRLLDAWARKGRIQVTFVDFADAATLDAQLARGPALVWLETPSNPLLRITDIAQVTAKSRAAGALSLVDNTFLSPCLQQPLALGADLVLHSTTKYINGHSDVVGGALVAATPELSEKVHWWANCNGLTGSAMDSYFTIRGLRTLAARMRIHQENAQRLAEFLHAHPAVAHVYYPGLPTHPQHALAARQQRGFGGMLSFDLAGGRAAVAAFVSQLRYFTLAESLGGVESLIEHPVSMSHAAMDARTQRAAGIGAGLLRMSVGIETGDDLLADVDQALHHVVRQCA